ARSRSATSSPTSIRPRWWRRCRNLSISSTGSRRRGGVATRSTICRTGERLRASRREVLAAPLVPLVGEVAHAGLLVLLDRPEEGVVVDTGLGLDGGDGLLAVAGVVAVHHREDRVRPVLVRRPAVAVAHEGEAGHARAHLLELLVGDGPDAHRVGLVAGAAVVHHG